jgi:hypothetical protein
LEVVLFLLGGDELDRTLESLNYISCLNLDLPRSLKLHFLLRVLRHGRVVRLLDRPLALLGRVLSSRDVLVREGVTVLAFHCHEVHCNRE